MARGKSINDLLAQAYRIRELSEKLAQRRGITRDGYGDFTGNGAESLNQRTTRASSAMWKYIDNIRKQKGYRNIVDNITQKVIDAYNRGGVVRETEIEDNEQEKANSLKYSRSAYMGLTNG